MASINVDFSIYRNKRTIIKGSLFDILNERDFKITVSDEWDEDVIVPIQ